MHEVLVNRLGGLSLPRKSVVRLTDRPDMTLDVYRGRKTTMQQQQKNFICCQRWDSNSLLSVHKPTTLVIQNVILIGFVASEKNLFKYVGGLS